MGGAEGDELLVDEVGFKGILAMVWWVLAIGGRSVLFRHNDGSDVDGFYGVLLSVSEKCGSERERQRERISKKMLMSVMMEALSWTTSPRGWRISRGWMAQPGGMAKQKPFARRRSS